METETIFFFELENKGEFSRPCCRLNFPVWMPKILIFISGIVLQNENPDFLNSDSVFEDSLTLNYVA